MKTKSGFLLITLIVFLACNNAETKEEKSFVNSYGFARMASGLNTICSKLMYLDTIANKPDFQPELIDSTSLMFSDYQKYLKFRDFRIKMGEYSETDPKNCDELITSVSIGFTKIEVQIDSLEKIDSKAESFVVTLHQYLQSEDVREPDFMGLVTETGISGQDFYNKYNESRVNKKLIKGKNSGGKDKNTEDKQQK